MYHEIKDNIYYLHDDNGRIVMTIQIDYSFDPSQIVITTDEEVYSGPVELINFSSDVCR